MGSVKTYQAVIIIKERTYQTKQVSLAGFYEADKKYLARQVMAASH